MAELSGITGLILAGGKSTRMGGIDKASILLDGRPMIEWVIDRFRPQIDKLILNSNAGTALGYLGYPIVADTIQGYAGPLAGLHAGIANARTPLIACVPCDAPLLPIDLVSRLRRELGEADIAVARTLEGLQPTFLLCRSTLGPSIEAFLAEGGRAFHRWLAGRQCVEVDFPDAAAFGNVNTPQEAKRIEAGLSDFKRA